MNTNAKLFWILCGFFVLADIIYVVWSIAVHNAGYLTQLAGVQAPGTDPGSPVEWAGTLTIGLSAVMSSASPPPPPPRGRPPPSPGPAEPKSGGGGAGGGFFRGGGGGPAAAPAGLLLFVVGSWCPRFWVLSLAVTAISLVGWVYEYYRGNFAR